MILALLGAVAGLAAALSAASAAGAAVADRRFPPHGRFVTVDGQAVHHVETPAADPADRRPPLLFIHGASANLDEMRVALEGAVAGRRAIYLDRPGHGHSARGPVGMSAPAAQARIAAGLLDALGIAQVVVVAHSFGASVAAALAVLHPEKVAGVVFVAPASHPWPGGVTWYYTAATLRVLGPVFAYTLAWPVGSLVLRAAARGVFSPEPMPTDYPRRARVPLTLRPRTFLANARDVADLKGNLLALQPRYREIRAPAAIVTGDADAVVWPSIHSEGLKRDVAGATLTVLPGAGHMVHQTRPGAVAEAIAAVTARAAAGTAAAPADPA